MYLNSSNHTNVLIEVDLREALPKHRTLKNYNYNHRRGHSKVSTVTSSVNVLCVLSNFYSGITNLQVWPSVKAFFSSISPFLYLAFLHEWNQPIVHVEQMHL